MAFLDRPRIKELTKAALKQVADFNGDIEAYAFSNFSAFHKAVFLSNLKKNINEAAYYDGSGNIVNDRYYDIDLSVGEFNKWNTVKDCIDYVDINQGVYSGSRNKIQFP